MGCTTSKPDQVIEPYYKTYPFSSPTNYAAEPNDSYTSYNSTSISDDMLKFLQELDRSNSSAEQQQRFPTNHVVHTNDHPSTTSHIHAKAEQVRDVGKYIHSLDKDQLDNHTGTGLRRIASPSGPDNARSASETGLIAPQSHRKSSSFVKRLFTKKAPSNSIADSSKGSSQRRKIISAAAAADTSLGFSSSSYELALKELADADPSLAFRQAPQESEAWDHAGINEAIKPASSAYDRALRELNAELESRHADDDDDDVGPSSLEAKHEPQAEAFSISPRLEPNVEFQGKRKSKPRDDPLAKFMKLCPPGGERSVVLYTTSLRGIRKTFEDCNTIRRVLESLFVHVDERDVALHQGFRNELKEMMQGASLASVPMPMPRLFIDGRYIGGAEEVLQLHEEEKLLPLLEGMPREQSQGQPCDGCGGVRFVPCLNCSGSRKVVQINTQNVIRCPECNENGLIQCPICN